MNKKGQFEKYLEESSADKIWKDYLEGQFSCNAIMLSSIVSTRKENEELKERLNKAIEYLNNREIVDEQGAYVYKCSHLLLEILKGDNNE